MLVSLPPSIARSLESKEIDIIVDDGTIKLNSVEEMNMEGQL
jgi:hypothetical protein